jgi:hypothetical protein
MYIIDPCALDGRRCTALIMLYSLRRWPCDHMSKSSMSKSGERRWANRAELRLTSLSWAAV